MSSSFLEGKEFASDFKSYPHMAGASRRGTEKQVEGFMNSHQVMPPESVASIPVTTFEDTQQMLRAYKKKKKELAKLKESKFKIETDFMTMKQKNSLVEEELIQSQKKLLKVEK